MSIHQALLFRQWAPTSRPRHTMPAPAGGRPSGGSPVTVVHGE
jgi:hypothetical protein